MRINHNRGKKLQHCHIRHCTTRDSVMATLTFFHPYSPQTAYTQTMQHLVRFALLALCLVGLSSFAQAQVTVSGKILNGTTGLPIPGLSVFLLDESGQSFPSEDVTDLEGRFLVDDVLFGTWYTLEVYSGKTLRFTDYVFVEGEDQDDDEQIIELPDITVSY